MPAEKSSASIPTRRPKIPIIDAGDTREGSLWLPFCSFLSSFSYTEESGGFCSLPRTDHLPRRDMNVRN